MIHDQEFLNEYFSKHWIPGANRGITNPLQIVRKIDMHDWLLDVGCGKNPFKKLHARTIGVDPAFSEADYRCTIEEYDPKEFKFDVATCLGSINFGEIAIIEKQIEKVVFCLKPSARIFWRLNPGRKDHDNELCDQIHFFPWSFDILKEFAKKHNFEQQNETLEEHPSRPRLYAEWIR